MQKEIIGCWISDFDNILSSNCKNQGNKVIYRWTHWQRIQFQQLGWVLLNCTQLIVRVYWHPWLPMWQPFGFNQDLDLEQWPANIVNRNDHGLTSCWYTWRISDTTLHFADILLPTWLEVIPVISHSVNGLLCIELHHSSFSTRFSPTPPVFILYLCLFYQPH